MKKLILLFLLVFSVCFGYSQVSINENFDNGTPSEWTDSYANTSTTPCAGSSERDNLWSSSTEGNLTTSSQVSNGTDLSVSFDYKIIDYSGGTATGAGWGTAEFQYSIDDGNSWTTVITIDDSNHTASTDCATIPYTIPGSSLPSGSNVKLQIINTWATGDYYFYVDNFIAEQTISSPPLCDAVLSETSDLPLSGNVSWSIASGAPTGYRISLGSTPGGTDIANNVDVQNNTVYAYTGFMYSTTYYVTIVPYNAFGDATGCVEQTFMTIADPNFVGTVTCGTTSTGTYCYKNNDANTWQYTADDANAKLKITFTAGSVENTYDKLIIYDGTDNSGTELYNGYGNSGDITGVSVESTGASLFFVFNSDGSNSCSSGNQTAAEWNVDCLTCVSPAGTATLGECTSTGYMIDVNVTDLAGNTSLLIKNDGGVADVTVTSTGVTSIGPFTFGAAVVVTIAPSDPVCNVILGSISTPSICGPDCASSPVIVCGATYNTGDLSGTGAWNPDGATSGACYNTPGLEKVWQFTPSVSGNHELSVTLSSGTSSWNDYFYRTDGMCDEAGWICIDDISGSSTPTVKTFGPLTAGETVYILVDSETSLAGRIHDFVINCPPSNNDCANAMELATDTPGALSGQVFGTATSSMAKASCDVGTNANPEKDLWYKVNTNSTGGTLNVTVTPQGTTTLVVSIYDACSGTELACAQTASPATATLTSASADTDYLVRVSNNSGDAETFSIEAAGAALPITLGSFSAKAEKRGNLVEWTTESEINSDYVEVLSSPNGLNKWSVAGMVSLKGESTTTQHYEFMDKNPYAITYYRLNSVDRDGTSEMSKIINVTRTDKTGRMALSPNPTSHNMVMQTVSSIDDEASIEILDLTGKKLLSQNVSLIQGLNTIDVDLGQLSSGVYLFTLQTSAGVQVEKIIKE